MQSRHSDTNLDHAEVLALQALAFLASNKDKFGRFLRLTGVNLDAIRSGATDSQFLASVLDYMLQDEPLLLEWCSSAGHHASDVQAARRNLPGFEPI